MMITNQFGRSPSPVASSTSSPTSAKPTNFQLPASNPSSRPVSPGVVPPSTTNLDGTAGMNPSQQPLASPLPLPKPPSNPANVVPPRTLWMGDVSGWWDDNFIVQLWAQLGFLVMVKVIKPKRNLLLRQISRNRGAQALTNHSGYCFVQFSTPKDAENALTLNGTPIPGAGGKPFRLNWATAATLDTQLEQTPEFSLFVGDLSSGTTEAHLLSLFQTHFNTVKTVRVMTDPATGVSRCFGFVRFTSEEDRNRALVEMNGKWLGGRPIRVALATPKHQNGNNVNLGLGHMMGRSEFDYPVQQKSPSNIVGDGSSGMGEPLMAQFVPTQRENVFSPYPGSGSAPYSGGQDPNNTTVFVGGINSSVSEDALRSLFDPFGDIVNVCVPPGKGCGFVRFTTHESAQQAVNEMQGFVLGGSRIRLRWGRSGQRRQWRQKQESMNQMSPSFANPIIMQSPGAPVPPPSSPPLGVGMSVGMGMVGMEMVPGPQGASQSSRGPMMGMPPGPQMFYDPYFVLPQPNMSLSPSEMAQGTTDVPANSASVPLNGPRSESEQSHPSSSTSEPLRPGQNAQMLLVDMPQQYFDPSAQFLAGQQVPQGVQPQTKPQHD